MSVVPTTHLFRFRFPVHRSARLPRRGKSLLKLAPRDRIPFPGVLDGAKNWADVRAAWTPAGLGFSVHVQGGSDEPRFQASAPAESDGLQIWLDTRNTQSIHRASRYCHHFVATCTGGGRQGTDAQVIQLPIARARENAPEVESNLLQARYTPETSGYVLEVWLPAEVLHGFDAENSPLLGFYCLVRDRKLGDQFLTVDHDFPFAADPSLWSTLDLVNQ